LRLVSALAARLRGPGMLAAAGACSAGAPTHTAPLQQEVAPSAVLAFYGDTSSVQLPASARVGDSVTLRFSTFGGSCSRPGTVDVVISGLRAEVRPYLEKPPAELPDTVVCTAELLMDWRVAHLRFARPGRAEVRIVGVAVPEDRRLVLVRDLQVTP
jgi:hypothetical protein